MHVDNEESGRETRSLSQAGPEDHVFAVDRSTGQVRFSATYDIRFLLDDVGPSPLPIATEVALRATRKSRSRREPWPTSDRQGYRVTLSSLWFPHHQGRRQRPYLRRRRASAISRKKRVEPRMISGRAAVLDWGHGTFITLRSTAGPSPPACRVTVSDDTTSSIAGGRARTGQRIPCGREIDLAFPAWWCNGNSWLLAVRYRRIR